MLVKFVRRPMYGFKIYLGADAWSRNFIGLTDYVLETLVACYCLLIKHDRCMLVKFLKRPIHASAISLGADACL